MSGGISQLLLNKRLGLFLGFFAALLMIATLFYVPSAKASPAPCDGSTVIAGYNRERWCGFFNNEGWTVGPALRGGTWSTEPSPGGSFTDPTAASPGVPADIDTAQEFVDMVLDDLHNGDARAVTSAQFIILSMLGVEPTIGGTVAKSVSSAQIAEWQARVLTYADLSDNGSGVSTGQNGSITWFEETHLPCGETNTYYQIDQDDVAPFLVNDTNTPNCVDPAFTEEYITFRDEADNVLLQIRRICMNPAGEINPLQAADPIPEDGTFGDKIFYDANQDGVFDAETDHGIEGVTVALYRVVGDACTVDPGQLIATTTTDANGEYQFTDLPVISDEGAFARYVAVVTDESNVLAEYTNTRGAEGIDNNGQDPSGYCFTLAFNERSNQTGDFSYWRADDPVAAVQEELASTGHSVHLAVIAATVAILAGLAVLFIRLQARLIKQ